MKILDACCGSRMFWFDKENINTVYMDNRTVDTTLCDGRRLIVRPDIIEDFRKMPFENETFYLVIFDPPHLVSAGDTSFLSLKYGTLKKYMAGRYTARACRMLASVKTKRNYDF